MNAHNKSSTSPTITTVNNTIKCWNIANAKSNVNRQRQPATYYDCLGGCLMIGNEHARLCVCATLNGRNNWQPPFDKSTKSERFMLKSKENTKKWFQAGLKRRNVNFSTKNHCACVTATKEILVGGFEIKRLEFSLVLKRLSKWRALILFSWVFEEHSKKKESNKRM